MPRRGSLRDRRPKRTARRRYYQPEYPLSFPTYLTGVLSDWLSLTGILCGVSKMMMNLVLAVMMMVYCVLQLVLLVRPKREENDEGTHNQPGETDDSVDLEIESQKGFHQEKRQKNSSKSANKSPRKQKGKSLVKASKCEDSKEIESESYWQSETEIFNFLNMVVEDQDFLSETKKLFAENKSYKTKLDVEKDRLLCTVCHEEERKLVIIPCMHFFMCKLCSEKLSLIGRKCPYCDRVAEDIREVFVV
ncbi:hypothetical protein Bbelb_190680 [Branchiostoma belcheri]|nr:hypothetical protein Bbelb_190680 [Branchiostoma belcheri]